MVERLRHTTELVARYVGTSEFYSGIQHGEDVLLRVNTTVYWYDRGYGCTPQHSTSSLSVQALNRKSAHLHVHLDEIENVRPLES